MKRFGYVLVLVFLLGSLSGCLGREAKVADPANDMPWESTGQAGQAGQAGGAGQAGMESDSQGYALNRPGGSSSSLEGPRGYGNEPGGYGTASEPEHRVFFELNSALINEETANVLAGNARWINTTVHGEVVIEGHCDERGTREFNLALGQNRAEAVRTFLISQGVDASRLRTISYGKERPLVSGHDEFAWSRNRRAEIVVQ